MRMCFYVSHIRTPRFCETKLLFRVAVEDHVRDMESMLDEELIQALDGSIAEKMENNHREKAR